MTITTKARKILEYKKKIRKKK